MKRSLKILSASTLAIAAMMAFTKFSGANEASYNEPRPESDSAILAKHIHEIKVNYALEEFSDHSFNAHLSEKQIDSLFALSGRKIVGARIIYSPDSAFKMASVGFESCDLFCSTEWWTWMHFTYDAQLVKRRPELHEILAISVMPDGKYLFIEQEKKTSLHGSVLLQRARLYELDRFEYTGQYYSFPGTHSVTLMQDTVDGLVLRNTYSNENYPPYLHYDSVNLRLSYSYNASIDERIDYDYAHIYSGYYVYENGRFIHKEEKRFTLAG